MITTKGQAGVSIFEVTPIIVANHENCIYEQQKSMTNSESMVLSSVLCNWKPVLLHGIMIHVT